MEGVWSGLFPAAVTVGFLSLGLAWFGSGAPFVVSPEDRKGTLEPLLLLGCTTRLILVFVYMFEGVATISC